MGITSACSVCPSEPACSGDVELTCEKVAALEAALSARGLPVVDDCSNPTSACYASYWRRHGIEPLSLLSGDPNAEDLAASLHRAQETAGSELLLTALGGLQSFLQDRAKQEAIRYAIERLNSHVCEETTYLRATCELLKSDDLELDEATLVRLKNALLSDLARLPLEVYDQLPAPATPVEAGLVVFARGGVETVVTATTSRTPAIELASVWAKKDKHAYQKLEPELRIKCSSTAASAMTEACWALLLPELGAAAAEELSLRERPSPQQLAAIIESAAVSFCSSYGAQGAEGAGACLLSSSTQYQQWEAQFQELANVSPRFVQLQRKAEALDASGIPSNEISERLLPELADAFDAWSMALAKVVSASDADAPSTFERTRVVLAAASAAAERDYPALLAVLADSFDAGQPFETVKPSATVMRSLGFAARLAAAKKPADAKRVFEEEAAELGSYRVKYDRATVSIAVNAFVGSFLGYGRQYRVRDATDPGLAARPLTAPLGIDFTLAASQYHHFGVLLAAIDPFGAGTVNEDTEAQRFDWGALLTPGVLLRWGIGGSPFTLLGGITGQPLARSNDDCQSTNGATLPCWRGALQVGGALAIDLPLVMLR